MQAIALPARRTGVAIVPRLSRGLLLAMVIFLFSGAFQSLVRISPLLLYATYLLSAALIGLCLLTDRPGQGALAAPLPYLAWTICYFVWGTLIAADRSLVLGEVVRALLRNILFIAAVAVALAGRRQVVALAWGALAAATANAAICLWEFANNTRFADPAGTPEVYNGVDQFRAAGLWVNPNQAGLAFVFALLLSAWCRGRLAWLGRVAALAGLYTTASRSNLYLLVLCGAIYAAYRLRTVRPTPGRVVLLVNALGLLLCVAWYAAASGVVAERLAEAATTSWTLARALDPSETTTNGNEGGLSRGGLAAIAAQAALEGPWYGFGVLSYSGGAVPPYQGWLNDPLGAHNIYIAVFGEVGALGFCLYLVVLVVGVARAARAPLHQRERLLLLLLWLAYLLSGLTLHTHFTDTMAIVCVGLLFSLPPAAAAGTVPDRARAAAAPRLVPRPPGVVGVPAAGGGR